jgi:hypothetical protein
VANFYENKKGQAPNWEEVGGFNTHLLLEMRSAMMDVRSESRSGTVLPVAVTEWIKRHPMFEFPDDEIG